MTTNNYQASYDGSSFYARTNITNGFLDYWVSISIPANVSDFLFPVTKKFEFRPDLIAYYVWGNDKLRWVPGVRNGLKDFIYDISVNTVLILPTREYL